MAQLSSQCSKSWAGGAARLCCFVSHYQNKHRANKTTSQRLGWSSVERGYVACSRLLDSQHHFRKGKKIKIRKSEEDWWSHLVTVGRDTGIKWSIRTWSRCGVAGTIAVWLGMMVPAFKRQDSAHEKQRQDFLCEFEASLGYTVRFRTASTV